MSCSFLRHIPSVPNFFNKLVAKEAEAGTLTAAAANGKAPYEVDEEEAGPDGETQVNGETASLEAGGRGGRGGSR